MADFWTAIKKLWRVGLVALIGAVAVEFMKLDWWWVAPIGGFLGALWKYLRTKYPDYWLWKLM